MYKRWKEELKPVKVDPNLQVVTKGEYAVGCYLAVPLVFGLCYWLALAVSYVAYGLYVLMVYFFILCAWALWTAFYVPLVCVFAIFSYLLVPIFLLFGQSTWYFAENILGPEPAPSDAMFVAVGAVETLALIYGIVSLCLNLKMVKQHRLCVVCLDRQREIVLKPCQHLCVCSKCVKELNNCPICRTLVLQHEKIYDA